MKVPRVDAKWDNVFIICAILCAIPSLIGILVVGYVVLSHRPSSILDYHEVC